MIADYSDERRETALSWLRKWVVEDGETLTDAAALMSAIGLVICDDNGYINADHIDEACADPSVLNYAAQLLTEARESA